MTKSLTILTSRKNHAWISMEEIITWIEDSWKEWARLRNIPCQIIMAEDSKLPILAKAAMESDLLVVTCFNTSVSSLLLGLRRKLGIQIPWVYYLHGLASYGSWPLFKWGLGELLSSHDLFIGSCTRDKKQFELIFKNIECRIIPFSLDLDRPIPKRKNSGLIRLAYIGRMTSQKNLHTLLVALSQVTVPFEIHFFGKEDDYGSPLIGKREKGYLSFLQGLSEKLGIGISVHFHGFKKREEIESFMNQDLWTFIAPSIHSDENFGMAAFRCLLNGHRAILSDWGGHGDYPQHFADLVKLVPVRSSEFGPYISIDELAHAIEEVSGEQNLKQPETMPEIYTARSIHLQYDDILKKTVTRKNAGEKALVTEVLPEILKRREKYILTDQNPEGIRIFENYQDELLKIFYRAYGMTSLAEKQPSTPVKRVPWAETHNGHIQINDPHRGSLKLSESTPLSGTGLIYGNKKRPS